MNTPARVLVLGGYGHFGARICRALHKHLFIELLIAGRDGARASFAASELGARHHGVALDCNAPGFAEQLAALKPAVVVHTVGPFQGQGYHVAEACMAAGAHYVDLADGRAFVAGVTALDARARQCGVLVTSGASTLPALSSAVIDEHQDGFRRIDTIDISIAPGQRTPRGVATLQAVLSYCGKPFQTWEGGRWVTAHGWQGLQRFHYPEFGARWLARCDVPDLQLFPERYGVSQRVRFDAALEVALTQFSLWGVAALVRLGLVRDAARYARLAQRCAAWFDGLGSDVGGMQIGIAGAGCDGRPARLDWHLTARRGHGPEIPCVAAIVIARELAAGRLRARGAMPCMGLMTLAQFSEVVSNLDIEWKAAWN
jgi:saccharopine dehydrogenase-like NADP-dependent oxidoreductase